MLHILFKNYAKLQIWGDWMKTLAEFKEYFKDEFSTDKKMYNRGLKRAEKIANIFRIASVTFGLLFSIVIIALAFSHFKYIYVVCVFGVIIFGILLGLSFYDMFIKEDIKERFENEDKPTLVSSILEKDFEYLQKGRIGAQEIKDSKLLPNFDEMDGEDLVKMKCKGAVLTANMTFSDVILKEIVKQGDSVTSEDIYSGFFLVVDFGKNIKCDVDVNTGKMKGMNMFSTESTLFNENFEVFCKDTKTAEKLFGAGVMLAMLNLKLTTGGEMKLRIRENKLYLCIDRELFSFNIEKKVEFESIRNIYDELSGIERIVREIMNRYEKNELSKKDK